MTDYPAWVTPATTPLCVAAGCVHRAHVRLDELQEPTPRFAVKGTDLCQWHHARFPRILGDLVTLAGQLDDAQIKKPNSGGGDRVQTSSVPDAGSFWNPAASAVLSDLEDWSSFIGRTIVHQYQLGESETHGLTAFTAPRLVLAIAASHYARWLSAYPALGPSLLNDAIDFRTQALRAIDTVPVKRLRVRGHVCGHLVEEGDWGDLTCGAPLSAILRPEDGGRPSQILCSAEPRNHPQLERARWMEYATRGR